ncbi:TIGR03826 family flagellar region protein [Desertibacillus haloalkaliphilus]|uniref:TIGR03826 family flagellar region protein n=1 Tax=Desertibacillus haloalkaliphilus TaxID=1328930 RepID=UPI001C2596F7|nr:TIGR03826 family flagellar region protein [Desertibacillus haloalkaliphilus]MBU8905984.1 hypothetical protein [Desertibacillus haloalkaliphilus]
MQNLENCPKCGKLFVKGIRTVCNDCHKEVEKMFETVYQFIRRRENRAATMEEVVEATGVSEQQISRFIREGRLQLAQFPNITYPCDSCGKRIREGRICSSCQSNLGKDLKQTTEVEKVSERNRREQEERARKASTYHSLGDRFDEN